MKKRNAKNKESDRGYFIKKFISITLAVGLIGSSAPYTALASIRSLAPKGRPWVVAVISLPITNNTRGPTQGLPNLNDVSPLELLPEHANPSSPEGLGAVTASQDSGPSALEFLSVETVSDVTRRGDNLAAPDSAIREQVVGAHAHGSPPEALQFAVQVAQDVRPARLEGASASELYAAAGRMDGMRLVGPSPLSPQLVGLRQAPDFNLSHPGLGAAGSGSTPGNGFQEKGPVQPGAASEKTIRPKYWLLRVIFGPLFTMIYRLHVRDMPDLSKGPAVLVLNHQTYMMDVFLLPWIVGRPVRFFIHRRIYDSPWLGWFFRAWGAIPIAEGDGRDLREQAFAEGRRALENGEIVAIFPEGQVTRTGKLGRIKRGFEDLVKNVKSAVPVVPVHIDGLWGSLFSFKPGWSLWSRLRMGRRTVTFRFGKPLKSVDAQSAREALQLLSAATMEENVRREAETLPRAFLRAAKKYWKRPAVVDTIVGRILSFGEILTAGVLLAPALRPWLIHSFNPPHVGVLLPPSAGAVITDCTLGILGLVPIHLNYSVDRKTIESMVQKARLKKIITSRKFIEALENRPPGKSIRFDEEFKREHFIYLEDFLPKTPEAAILARKQGYLHAPAWKKQWTYVLLRILPRFLIEALYFRRAHRSLQNLATIIFTSGSSGDPKGVMLTHANIQADIRMMSQIFPFTSDEVLLGVLPFFHSFGYTVGFKLPFEKGMLVVYHTDPKDTQTIEKLAQEHKPTVILGTPAFYDWWQAISAPREGGPFSRLRWAIVGAAKLLLKKARTFTEKFGVELLEGYGASELSPVTSVNIPNFVRNGRVEQIGHKPGTVGQPLPGVAVRVVDPETFEILPDGQEGLLLVNGTHVMKGYWDGPEETAKAFYVDDNGVRWYVTGDIAKLDRDGFITLVDRLSNFAKVAGLGEQVPLTLVEDALNQDLEEPIFVVTFVRDEQRGGDRLVVLYRESDDVTQADIRAALKRARDAGLRPLQIPSADSFFPIEDIPLLGGGKPDMRKLKQKATELLAASRD